MRSLDNAKFALTQEGMSTSGQEMTKTIRSDGQQELCRLLVEVRKSKGMTQGDLALRLGCQQSLIARLESGERRLDVIEFVTVARALATAPGDLLSRIEPFVAQDHRL